MGGLGPDDAAHDACTWGWTLVLLESDAAMGIHQNSHAGIGRQAMDPSGLLADDSNGFWTV